MARVAACCCCFSNNVRQLVLLLSTACAALLFANLVLFHLTAVLHVDLAPQAKPVAGLDSLHEYTIWHDRRKREAAWNRTDDDEGFPVARDRVGNIVDYEDDDEDDDDGHPILPSTTPPTTTTRMSIITRKTTKPKTVYITNSPTATTMTTSMVKSSTVTSPTTTVPRGTTVKRSAAYPTDDVVMQEVERTLKKLKEAEKQEEDEKKGGAKAKGDNAAKAPAESIDEKNAGRRSDRTQADIGVESVMRGVLYAAPGIGVLIGTVPAMVFVRRIGVRKLFTATMVLSAVATLCYAFVVPFGFSGLISLRLLQGIFFAPLFPVIGSIAAHWGTVREQLQFIATLFLFFAFGPIVSWPMTMVWHSNEVPLLVIYGVHAGLLLLFALMFVFFLFYRDRPQHHPWVNGFELNRIVAGKVQEIQSNRATAAPCSTLLRSLSAWSIWTTTAAVFFVVALFATYLPSLLCAHEVFLVDYLGVYATLPFVLVPATSALSGLANLCRCSSSTAHVRVWNTLALGLTAVFTICLPLFASVDTKHLLFVILPLTLAPLGLIVAGVLRSLTIVGRLYAQHIVAYMGVSFGVAFAVLPFVVAAFVHEHKLAEWVRVFFVVLAALLIAAVEFAIFGRGRSASWAERSWDPLAKTKMNSLALIDYNQDECGLYELRHIGPAH